MNSQETKQQSLEESKADRTLDHPDCLGWILYGGISLAGAALDLWSKWAVFNWLGPPRSGHIYTVIPGFFQLVPRLNSGAAFSIFQGERAVLAGVSILALLIVLYLFLTGRLHRRIFQIAAGCITAGIVGNLYDRLFNDGLVRDFLDVYIGTHHWPTFNVADSLLCIGVGLILLGNFTSEMDRPRNPSKKSEP